MFEVRYIKSFDKTKLVLIVSIFVALFTLVGTSYALLKSSSRGENTYTMSVGNLEVTFHEFTQNDKLVLTDMYPMSDREGMLQTNALNFTIENTGDFRTVYSVYLNEQSNNPSFKEVIRYAINKNNTNYGDVLSVRNNMLYIDEVQTLNAGETANYKVKIWLDESADDTYMGKTFSANLIVTADQIATITFNANEGTVSSSSKVVAATSSVYGELPEPSRSGYQFLGWYTELEGGIEVTANTPFTYGTSPQILYAHWTSSVPTMAEMCPDCVYVTSRNAVDKNWYTTWNTESKIPTVVSPSDWASLGIENNFDNVFQNTGKTYFLGIKLNESYQIEKAYGCDVENNIPYCLETSTDNKYYQKNVSILNTVFSKDKCTEDDISYTCIGDSSSASTYKNGDVSVGGLTTCAAKAHNTGHIWFDLEGC